MIVINYDLKEVFIDSGHFYIIISYIICLTPPFLFSPT